MTEKHPLDRACDAVGSAVKLAAALNVTAQAITNWKERGVPEDRCVDVEIACSGAVTVEELRPATTWVRVKDKTWPHPKGRPLVDHGANRELKEVA